jgi:hypothetical protein
VADFTGRSSEVSLLTDLLTPATEGEAIRAVVVSAVAGKPGVGKTALAVHVAHRLRERFADGQLYINLRGAERQPMAANAVPGRFLRALGIEDGDVPRDQDEREALYRARLADRRVLVVLDNAAGEAQVRPLLPGMASCAVLVTSRERLAGLEGARLLELEVLDHRQTVELLGHIVTARRVAAEPAAASELVGHCGHLPLAIRVPGARLAIVAILAVVILTMAGCGAATGSRPFPTPSCCHLGQLPRSRPMCGPARPWASSRWHGQAWGRIRREETRNPKDREGRGIDAYKWAIRTCDAIRNGGQTAQAMLRRVRDQGRFTEQGARVIVTAALGTLCPAGSPLPP